jgi:hypothetical protein
VPIILDNLRSPCNPHRSDANGYYIDVHIGDARGTALAQAWMADRCRSRLSLSVPTLVAELVR